MNKRQKEIFGLLLIVFSLLSIISLIGHNITENPSNLSTEFIIKNPLSYFGVYISYYHFIILGYSSIIFPIIILLIGYSTFANKNIKKYKKDILHILCVGVWVSIFISYIGGFNDPCPGCPNSITNNFYNHSGLVGFNIYIFLRHILGFYGSSILILITFIIIITSITKSSIFELFNKIIIIFKESLSLMKKIYLFIVNKIKLFRNSHKNEGEDVFSPQNNNNISIAAKTDKSEDIIDVISEETTKVIKEDNAITKENESDEIFIEEEKDIHQGDLDLEQKEKYDYFKYKLPKTEFLNDPVEIVKHSEEELIEKGKQLKYFLNTFGVDGEIVKISPGPIISLFEIEPAEGVRVSKFVNLSDDLARVMKAQRVRIIAPIPGSKSVGIELPNDNKSIVYLKTILNSNKFIENKSKLTIALGKTTSGAAYVFDLCEMPHLLVAGSTGSGKSVCINTIILSILYNAKPDEVKFILLDPKKIELSTYQSLVGYHLITAPNIDEYVMTTPENSVAILNSAITEMERRFQVFADTRVRNIKEYHSKQVKNKELENMPYVVVLVDELADLMMTSGRSIEEPITRLAQKARAVGIHLVVATQRPSVDVVTGLIKSNFPSRISFLVSSRVDSRTILDQIGAEKLLGKGDMLFLLPGSNSPIRIHNAFVTLEEIEKVMHHISSQPKPNEIKLPETEQKNKELDIKLNDNQDELLKDAAELVINQKQASVSLLQRKFRIGYSRAGRLIDELESLGIVSGYSGSKAREVLIDHTSLNDIFNE